MDVLWGALALRRLVAFLRRHWLVVWFFVVLATSVGLAILQLSSIPISSRYPYARSNASTASAVWASVRVGPIGRIYDAFYDAVTYRARQRDPSYEIPEFGTAEWVALSQGLETGMCGGYVDALSLQDAFEIRERLLTEQALYREILDRPDRGEEPVLLAVIAEMLMILWLPFAAYAGDKALARRRCQPTDASGGFA